jgi:hypothetical protein
MKPEVEAKTEKLIGKYFRSANETNRVEWQGAVIAEPHPGWYLVQLFEWGSGAGVTWRTAKAVVERESRQIAVRKQELLEQSLRIARRAANRIEDNIEKLPVGQLIPAFGVAVDKIAVLADPLTQTSQHLHLHLQSQDIAGTFNSLLHSLQEKAKALHPSPPPALTDKRTDTGQPSNLTPGA